MLRYLKISNFAIIDNVEIEFRDGFNALTGETGAGKSILIGALGILLGAKCSADIIRAGSEEARVEGLFELSDSFVWPEEFDLKELRSSELVIIRRINSSGRSRCSINGELASVATLQKLGTLLVNVFGQHESHVLLNPDEHTEILDRCQKLYTLRRKVQESYSFHKEIQGEFRKIEKKVKEHDLINRENTETVKELTSAQLKESEEDTLIAERDVLKKASQIRERSYEAYQSLYGKSGSAIELLAEVKKNILFLAAANPELEELRNSFDEASYRLEDVAHELRRISENFRSNPDRLERIEERLGLIRKLKKKYSADLPGLLRILNELSQDSEEIYKLEKALKAKRNELEHSFNSYMEDARKLSESRMTAAKKFQESMESELKALSMAEAKFEVIFHAHDPKNPRPFGLENVEFYLQSNPGETSKPLSKIASGGELSRLMLAIKTLEVEPGNESTLIFDEVDAGIGGHTAVAVAERLSRIAKHQQTICITHLHQIAAKADHHLAVRKSVKDGRTFLEVAKLSADGRVDELTRMIGADPDASPLREHVKKLMKK